MTKATTHSADQGVSPRLGWRKLVDVRLKVQKQSLQRVFSAEAGRTFEIVAPIAPESPESIQDFIETKEVPSGTVLTYQGKRVRKVQMIQRGLVMLVRRDSEGREVLVGLRSDGWYAGAISAILDRPSTYSVKTVTRCRTTQIMGKHLILQLTQNPEMMRRFTLALCQEITSKAWKQLRMSGRAGNDLDWQAVQHFLGRGVDPVPLFDQAELAHLLSLSPEHLCKLIYEFMPHERHRPHPARSGPVWIAASRVR